MKTWTSRLEDLLVSAHDSVAHAYHKWQASRLREVSALRGRGCHCPLPVHYLHSEGLREGCDYVVDYGSNVAHPKRRSVPVFELGRVAGQIEAGAAIYVKADLLGRFLPHLRSPVVLVTGDSDYSPVRDCRHLLDDPRLLHWFAQNCDLEESHPKLTPIPIGLDNPCYTRLDKRLGFLLTMLFGRTPFDPTLSRNDMGDQAVLQRIPVVPFPAKPARALCTFHRNQKLVTPDFHRLPDRSEAYRVLMANPCCHFPTRRLRQLDCWGLHRQFAFEVSPQGNGLDCFRTWEALILQTVPIVRSSPLDRLYREYPVVIVDSWEEVSAANLELWQRQFAEAFTPDLTWRLTCDYWLQRIHSR